MVPLLPFVDGLMALHDARRNLTSIDAQAAARNVTAITKQIDSLRGLFDAPTGRGAGAGPCASIASGPTRASPLLPAAARASRRHQHRGTIEPASR